MDAYKELGLYNYVRNSLVHNYSSQGKFDIDSIGFEDVPYFKNGSKVHINTNVFVRHLEEAFKKLVKDFRENSSIQNNAQETSKHYPVMVDTR
ncbi:MAG: hypothetical protein IPL84_08640 [Chitinophagaceae bacterium]|nr:hypothetical protein [Chitinophagaceae bacterium]